jgi:hypothetical protein
VVKIAVVPKEQAMITRRARQPGVRRLRMNQFDEYVDALRQNPEEAVVYEELAEPGQKFVLSLRGAFRRAGMENVVVRKMRGRDEVRVWVSDAPPGRQSRVAPPPAPAKRGGRGRAAR